MIPRDVHSKRKGGGALESSGFTFFDASWLGGSFFRGMN